MFFKNLTVFRLNSSENFNLATLNEQLGRNPFRECHASEAISAGWVPTNDAAHIHRVDGAAFATLAVQTKILPAAALNEEVKKRADAMAESQGYAPGRKALRELKERVIEELLPSALKKTKHIHVMLDLRDGWLAIDAASGAHVDAVIEQLRYCLDAFPAAPLRTTLSPSSAMADWLACIEAPTGFSIDQDCQLKSIDEEKSTVTYARQSLESVAQEIREHLASGKQPTKLALTWDDRISFVLTDSMTLRRLAFLDIVQEAAEKSAEHADEQAEADRMIMLGELRRLLPAVVDALGGEVAE